MAFEDAFQDALEEASPPNVVATEFNSQKYGTLETAVTKSKKIDFKKLRVKAKARDAAPPSSSAPVGPSSSAPVGPSSSAPVGPDVVGASAAPSSSAPVGPDVVGSSAATAATSDDAAPDTHADETAALGQALKESRKAIDLFFNNEFEHARKIVQPLANKSIYHALGYGVFMYLKAVMTFEEKHIEEASLVLTEACDTIHRFRRKTGIAEGLGKMIGKSNGDYNVYTETELHAELCYAEVILLKAVLTLAEDETLVSFVKAGLKVRTCYHSFRECWQALQYRDWSTSAYRADFESGVRMGVGTFNLLISLLPPRVLRLLQFIGFNGSREIGLKELHMVYEEKAGLRQFLASLVLLGYNLFVTFFMGNTDCDEALCSEILREKQTQYADGAFFLFFKGRLHFIQGDMNGACKWYQASCDSQDEWPQFHHICYWEIVWANTFRRNWWEAARFAELLFEQSRWSKCFYAYWKAAVLCMVQDELTDDQRREQIATMKRVPALKQRIAGKSLPMEKFAICKAERFLDESDGHRLTLPALELIYAWNGFRILGRSWNLVEPVYVLVEKEMKKIEATKSTNKYYFEDMCLLHLLKGMCLKYMKSPLQAEECFKTVLSFSSKLRVDKYLVPYALAECAFLLKDQGQVKEAMDVLESAKNDYKDYSLQNRLHLRIHAVQSAIKLGQKLKAKSPMAAPAPATLASRALDDESSCSGLPSLKQQQQHSADESAAAAAASSAAAAAASSAAAAAASSAAAAATSSAAAAAAGASSAAAAAAAAIDLERRPRQR